VGSGSDVTIKELAELIAEKIGFKGLINWDSSKPDGTPQKLLDASKLKSLGWEAKISTHNGITTTIENCSKELRTSKQQNTIMEY